jgi:hypothetical protein
MTAPVTPELLIAGTRDFPRARGALDVLPDVPVELAIVGGALQESCGAPVPTPMLNPTSTELLAQIAGAVRRGGPDPLVVYYSGHGESIGGRYYLATHDTGVGADGGWRTNAVAADQLLGVIMDADRPVVLIIDACYAGDAGREMQIRAGIDRLVLGGESNHPLWVIPAATRGQAAQLVFARALLRALRRPGVGRHPAYVTVDQLEAAIRRELVGQAVELTKPLPGEDTCTAFRNPLHGPGTAARRVSVFVGRQRARTDIAAGLSAPASGIVAVVGDVGCGKSALLAQVEDEARARGQPTVFLDGRGRTTSEVFDELFYQLRLDRPALRPQQLAALRDLPGRPVAFVDGIDETHDDELAGDALELTGRSGGLRLVVAGRTCPDAWAGQVSLVDLDDAYFERADLLEFAATVLRTTPGSHFAATAPGVRRTVAHEIVAHAGRSFLEAEYLARGEARPAPRRTAASAPRTSGDADILEDRADELLTPLAFAGPPGMPADRRWLSMVEALHGRAYPLERLVGLLARETGKAVTVDEGAFYRLTTDELRDSLRSTVDPARAHAVMARALIEAVDHGDDGTRRWTQADPYTIANLAVHAGRGNLLPRLLADPGFLLVADPTGLELAVPHDGSPESQQVIALTSVLRQSVGLPTDERAARLAYVARVSGMHDLAQRLHQWTLAWQTRWVTGPADEPTTAVAWCEVDGERILFTGDGAGRLARHRLRDGWPLARVESDDPTLVTALAAASVNGSPVVLFGDFHGAVRLHYPATGAVYRIRQRGDPVTSCAVAGRYALAATESDWTVFDLVKGETVTPPSGRSARSFVAGFAGGQPVVTTTAGTTVLNALTGVPLAAWRAPQDSVRGASTATVFGKVPFVAVGTHDGGVHLVRPFGEPRLMCRHGASVAAIRAVTGRAGGEVWSAAYDGVIHRVRLAAIGPPDSMTLNSPVADLALIGDGTAVVAARQHGTALVGWPTTADTSRQDEEVVS